MGSERGNLDDLMGLHAQVEDSVEETESVVRALRRPYSLLPNAWWLRRQADRIKAARDSVLLLVDDLRKLQELYARMARGPDEQMAEEGNCGEMAEPLRRLQALVGRRLPCGGFEESFWDLSKKMGWAGIHYEAGLGGGWFVRAGARIGTDYITDEHHDPEAALAEAEAAADAIGKEMEEDSG